jgi:hypothetical protein
MRYTRTSTATDVTDTLRQYQADLLTGPCGVFQDSCHSLFKY